MKVSKYTYLFKSDKWGFLLYNSMTNSFAEINEDLYNLLIEAKNDIKCLEILDNDIINKLKEAKILCDDIDETNQFYHKRLQYYSHSFNQEILSLTIAPTTACNFACPYCYEEGVESKTMSDETINNLFEFIKSYKKIEGIDITWYGGEPLLATNIINKII